MTLITLPGTFGHMLRSLPRSSEHSITRHSDFWTRLLNGSSGWGSRRCPTNRASLPCNRARSRSNRAPASSFGWMCKALSSAQGFRLDPCRAARTELDSAPALSDGESTARHDSHNRHRFSHNTNFTYALFRKTQLPLRYGGDLSNAEKSGLEIVARAR